MEILEKYKKYVINYKSDGKVGIPGGFGCPYCESDSVVDVFNKVVTIWNVRHIDYNREYFQRVCIKDPTHKFVWTVWGG